MAKPSQQVSQHGYRPITEGYQPGEPRLAQDGYVPLASSAKSQPPPPPKGGSSAAKPAQKQ